MYGNGHCILIDIRACQLPVVLLRNMVAMSSFQGSRNSCSCTRSWGDEGGTKWGKSKCRGVFFSLGDDLVTFVDVSSPVGWKYGLVGWKYGLVTFALLLLPSVFSLVVCFGLFLEWQLQNYLGLYFMVSVMKMNTSFPFCWWDFSLSWNIYWTLRWPPFLQSTSLLLVERIFWVEAALQVHCLYLVLPPRPCYRSVLIA